MKQRHSNFGVIYGIVDSVTLQSMFEIKSKGWKLKTIKIAISNPIVYIANKTGLLFISNNVNKKLLNLPTN